MSFNKVALYFILLLTYLGLSKGISPSEFGISYVFNEKGISEIVQGSPVSVILVNTHATGFIIKTYYHKYKIVYGFHTYEELVVRTSRSFTSKHAKHIGMSIFRRDSQGKETTTPLPPGSVFIGNRDFGRWKNRDNIREWEFYRAYRYIPQYLGYHNFRPTYEFYRQIQSGLRQNQAFFGFNDEFGTKGALTQKAFPQYFQKGRYQDTKLKDHFLDFFRRNFHPSKELR